MTHTSIIPDVTKINSLRIESIDLLRGVVMILMAVDHVRDYFHFGSFLYSPVDITKTSVPLFVTRWITHLCAPTFIFLAGTSTYFVSQRKSLKEASFFLMTRGVWLIVLQLTLIRFAWNFDPLFHYNSNTIISVIGICMLALSALIHFRIKIIFVLGLVMIAGHNLFDSVSFESGTIADVFWAFLHEQKSYDLGNGYSFTFLYPVVPWIGVMALGYCFGCLYDPAMDAARRKKILFRLGAASLVGFVLLRYSNLYGDSVPWSEKADFAVTIMSFFNLQKYPPSLLFLMATLGIAFLLLSFMEKKNLLQFKPLIVFGRVALFYYVIHILLAHLLATAAALLTGFPWQSMIFTGPFADGNPLLNGRYGFSLPLVYFVWMAVILMLYPLCVYWDQFKSRHKKKWWVSYI
jgi:uncharacterized membrane protein